VIPHRHHHSRQPAHERGQPPWPGKRGGPVCLRIRTARVEQPGYENAAGDCDAQDVAWQFRPGESRKRRSPPATKPDKADPRGFSPNVLATSPGRPPAHQGSTEEHEGDNQQIKINRFGAVKHFTEVNRLNDSSTEAIMQKIPVRQTQPTNHGKVTLKNT